MKSIPGALLLFCLGLLAVSCECPHHEAYHTGPPIPSFRPEVTPENPMRRVAVLPVTYEIPNESSLSEVDAALTQELGKTSLFELVPVSRESLAALVGRRQVLSVEVLPGELLAKLSATYGVDGVLLTDLTYYRPYQPLAIGLRSKLIDVRTGRIRWAFDHLFDAGNLETANAARGYYVTTSPWRPTVEPPLPEESGAPVLQSPSRFAKYVAWEAFRSLLTPNQVAIVN
jgi:hypothetical protein